MVLIKAELTLQEMIGRVMLVQCGAASPVRGCHIPGMWSSAGLPVPPFFEKGF